MARVNLRTHLGECTEVTKFCPFNAVGCPSVEKRGDMDTHLKVEAGQHLLYMYKDYMAKMKDMRLRVKHLDNMITHVANLLITRDDNAKRDVENDLENEIDVDAEEQKIMEEEQQDVPDDDEIEDDGFSRSEPQEPTSESYHPAMTEWGNVPKEEGQEPPNKDEIADINQAVKEMKNKPPSAKDVKMKGNEEDSSESESESESDEEEGSTKK